MTKKSLPSVFISICMIIFSNLSISQEKEFKRDIHKPHFRFFREATFQSKIREPYNWPVSTPEAQGLDSSIFENAFNEAEKVPYLYSLIVIKNGYLIAERYFHLQDKYDAHNVFSVSKSFTSALVGIALRENYLHSLDQKMMDFFPEYITPNMEARKFNITLEHLLTMKAGFDWDENEENFTEYHNSPDWVQYVLGLPLRDNPGERFHYTSLQTNLLSAIITRTSGMSTKDFAEKYLFIPLNISIRRWTQDAQGYYLGGYDMYYTPRDMAIFGYLYLNEGLLDGKQIVPEEWVKKSIEPSSLFDWTWGPMEENGYGYKWWMGKIYNYELYYASGMGGQYIMNIPELNMIIVTTMEWNGWSNPGQILPIELIANHILSPIRCLLGPPPYFPLGVSAQKIENSGLAYREYISVLRWQPNPRNAGVNISGYRIYRILDDYSWQLLREVEANTFEYWHRDMEEDVLYTYGISSVTDDSKESIPAFVTVQYPTNQEN